MKPSLSLASSSSYRAELLRRLGLQFTQDRPDVDETPLIRETPRATAVRLAELKARVVAERHPGAIVIGSDQLASLEDEALGKPGTLERAKLQLSRVSGKVVTFHTAVCVLDSRNSACHIAEVPCVVEYRTLTSDQIDAYLSHEPALDCAGAAKIEGLGISLTRSVRCDDPTALIGLPLITVVDFLNQCGVAIP